MFDVQKSPSWDEKNQLYNGYANIPGYPFNEGFPRFYRNKTFTLITRNGEVHKGAHVNDTLQYRAEGLQWYSKRGNFIEKYLVICWHEEKTADYGISSKSGSVAYYINDKDKVVYYTQISGTLSSINGAEYIICTICSLEKINFLDYKWVDIQTTQIYLESSMDELMLDTSKPSPFVQSWKPVEVPEEVLAVLL